MYGRPLYVLKILGHMHLANDTFDHMNYGTLYIPDI
jgi:hypothetical protein